MTKTLQAVVGANARAIRTGNGVTLDAVARAARAYGIRWATARVLELERGELHLPATLLVVLADILSNETRTGVTITDLLAGDGYVQLAPNLTVKLSAVRDGYQGEPVAFTASDVSKAGEFMRDLPIAAAELDEAWSKLPSDSDVTLGDLRMSRHEATLTDERAAKKLGISTLELMGWAQHLWGQPLSAESASRATTSTKQAKGQATRKLINEVRQALDRG